MLSVSLQHRLPDLGLNVQFEAPSGVTVLFGRSGTGKTTVIQAVAGLLQPDQGRVTLGGEVLFDTGQRKWLPPNKRRMGYIFQEGRLFPHLTVRQNLLFGQWFAPRGAKRESLDRVVELLGIGPLLQRRPGLLSGGEKQRVAIGRALLAAPRMILADEPLSALDEARKAEILPYFERLRDEVGIPVLYVCHSAAEVARLATTVVVLQDGQVQRQGSAAEVLSDSAVLPAGVRAAGALLEAQVARHHADGLTELNAGGVPLFLPQIAKSIGSPVRVRILAHDVILSRHRPEGLSALNILPGTVEHVRTGSGPGAMVSLQTPAGRVLARVTRRSAQALELEAGAECFTVVKTVSIAPEDIGAGG
ncbi:molybdenum ABC transporter ATP-binding protein [Leisingera methylohalidivorans]|uniref:Molybdenum ABC transporter ATP-binding protein n=1 Tax=Leisingera methylohalidivorans DSM 14336 TaxID=999552 RepID=V9VYK3_9RHOB|nr:molybdenum ABC transporter ATP-binding protein [Leisingera methylohalidivorans]AHD03761.1 molybdenum ABC transporter ATP-binding protein [Leisingera methylohalidivorans DSM 14336]